MDIPPSPTNEENHDEVNGTDTECPNGIEDATPEMEGRKFAQKSDAYNQYNKF